MQQEVFIFAIIFWVAYWSIIEGYFVQVTSRKEGKDRSGSKMKRFLRVKTFTCPESAFEEH